MNNEPSIRSGLLKSFDAGTYRAVVQLTGSLLLNVTGVPVARDIAAAELTVDRKVAIAFFDPTNPSDAVLFAVWT